MNRREGCGRGDAAAHDHDHAVGPEHGREHDHAAGHEPALGLAHDHHGGGLRGAAPESPPACAAGDRAAAHAERALDRRLWASIALNTIITVAEVVGGLLSGSLALLADALHNAGDVAALVLAAVARRIGRRPPSAQFTYGLKRVEVFAALLNAAVMVFVAALVVHEAVHRLLEPRAVGGRTMLVVATIALLANAFSVLLLRGHGAHDLNLRAAVLHLMQDALASVVVIVAALFAGTAAGPWLDPLASLVICAAVLRSAVLIVREALTMLAEGTPAGLDPEALVADIAAHCEGARLRHLHVWEVGPGQRTLTAQLLLAEMPLSEAQRRCAAVHARLRHAWGIGHATLEPEVDPQPGTAAAREDGPV